MSLVTPMLIDTERAKLATELYNRAYDMLTEAGWKEQLEDPDMFWTKGKPTWWWRHPDHTGTFAMDTALIVVAQSMPKRQ